MQLKIFKKLHNKLVFVKKVKIVGTKYENLLLLRLLKLLLVEGRVSYL